MREQRILEIKGHLTPYAPDSDVGYTNQEIVDKLKALQDAMANEVFALNHAEHFAARDIMIHFGALATEYNLNESTEYQRLATNMKSLGCTIGKLIKGVTGERRTRTGLQNMKFDPNVRILYNITLQDEMSETEYDAIVITPYGVFVVEAKNFQGTACINEKGILERQDGAIPDYNLGERMNNKEFLLRNCLGDLASVPYYGFLLYVDESADIISNYDQIATTYCNTIVSDIRKYDHGEIHISPEQVVEIEKRIMEHSVDSKYPCKVDCKQIIDDFAFLMSEIEEQADKVNQAEGSSDRPCQKIEQMGSSRRTQLPQPQKHRIWPHVLGGAALFVSGIAIGRKL